MTNVVRVHRGLLGDPETLLGDVVVALDTLGVKRGESFVVGTCGLGRPDENRLGPSKSASTSRKAALANYPRSGTQRATILTFVAQREFGATRDEIELYTGYSGSAVRPRVLELIEGGWLHETVHTRPTRGGDDAMVLIATSKAAT